jgi:hypothetical protein
VAAVEPDPSHAFVAASVTPAARLDRSGGVLLVWDLPDDGTSVGPPTPDDLPTRRAAAAQAQRAADAKRLHTPAPPPPSQRQPTEPRR